MLRTVNVYVNIFMLHSVAAVNQLSHDYILERYFCICFDISKDIFIYDYGDWERSLKPSLRFV